MLKTWVRHSFAACALPLWLALQGPGACASPVQATTDAGVAVSLAELEHGALAAAPSIRLAEAEQDLAVQRTRAVQAGQGARLFGGTGISASREAVTDTLSRDYQRLNVQLGVRWPLLGSRDAQLRSVHEAELAAQQGQVRLRQARQDAVQAVRQAYVRHLRSAQRVHIAQAFLSLQPQAQAQLRHRRDAGVMLDDERLPLLGLFDAAQLARDSQRAQQASSLRELTRLTNQPQSAVQTQPMVWPASCLHADALQEQADQHPSIVLAQLELNTWNQVAATMQRTGLESSISMAQGFSRDLGGPNGRNSVVGVDFSMPLQWRAQRDATLAQIQREHARLESLLHLRRSEHQAQAAQAQAQWQLRRTEMPRYLLALQAAQEAVRVASLRLEAFDGDGYARLLKAQHALYQAAIQVADGAERLDLAALDLLALAAGECGSPSPARQDDVAIALTALAALAPTSTAAANRAVSSQGLGWYIWNGQALLNNPTRLATLPQGSARILLSFTAPQLRALTQPIERKRVTRLLAQAHARGLRVELLLGEPTWVLPSQRQGLLELLASLRSLPFDGLHLDLERSQLPLAQQPGWEVAVVDTLRAVHAAVAWPLALTTHYRELQAPDFAQRIHAAGVTELVVMVYVSDPGRASDIARPLLRGPAGLRLAVAQSIERTLPPQESSFNTGQAQALSRWHQLSQALAPVPGFSGIVVQSWDEFIKARP